MNALKKTWVWLCRFRKRKGYGVHSPFAYDFIRTVINERGKYYAYDDLKPLRKTARRLAPANVDKLLFRLANHFQPATALQVGEGGSLSLRYIQAGCRRAQCKLLDDAPQAIAHWQDEAGSWGMLYICETDSFKEVFEAAFPWACTNSVVVIDSPYGGEEKRKWWHALEDDPRISLTFDLYEVGIALLNVSYCKNHYKVNFV